MRPFMMEIDEARGSPLERLAVDYLSRRPRQPSLDFCCCLLGARESDEVVARRLGVATGWVRTWREVGRRVGGRSRCP